VSSTLPLARAAFLRSMNGETTDAERTRLLGVLDAMLAWTAAHPDALRFRPDDNEKGALRFEQVSTGTVFWSAIPRRGNAPVLELLPSASRLLSAEEKARAISILNSHTRETLDPDGRLQLGFGALKNTAARAAVLQLMEELLGAVNAGRQAKPVS
jgi:hypothetical protein